uniref:MBL fold metallo-hydrolase n=1 Tax=Herbidospora sakaeratensis TaxID=564415 RepID=UPI0007837239|nr:MBL fold metallo-hydrolase [Herbidospora sakaeratensis]
MIEVADGVWIRRHTELDLTLGLVVGETGCLVVDTGIDEAFGHAWADAIREVTDLPWTVVLTHAHFDHAFGTAAFGTCFATEGCREALVDTAHKQAAEWSGQFPGVATAPVVLPLRAPFSVDLGGREVLLGHPGPGHTGHDLTVHVPDAGVLFAGDLVEQGAPPQFGDSYPGAWPMALEKMLEAAPRVIVPGHGDPVTPDFVERQRAEITEIVTLCERLNRGELDIEGAAARSPYPRKTLEEALGRTIRRRPLRRPDGR